MTCSLHGLFAHNCFTSVVLLFPGLSSTYPPPDPLINYVWQWCEANKEYMKGVGFA